MNGVRNRPEPGPSAALAALESAYADRHPAAPPLRLTPRGLYAATPLDVLVAGFEILLREDALRGPGSLAVLDAGSGDGRMLAALALCAPAAYRLRLVGVECDPGLHAAALERRERLAALPDWPPARRLELRLGDLADPGCVALGDFDLVLHYPDGGEAELARRLADQGRPGVRLLWVQPDPPRAPAPLELLWRTPVRTSAGVGWHVALLGRAGSPAARLGP